jgi:hypothetical protein
MKTPETGSQAGDAKIINLKDYAEYNKKLSELVELASDCAEEIYENLFILACMDKWKTWSDSQPVGTEFYLDDYILRDTGDRNIDLLFEIYDKIQEVKEKTGVYKPEKDSTDDDDDYNPFLAG